MKTKIFAMFIVLTFGLLLSACNDSADRKEAEQVDKQQKQYIQSQPMPFFDFSFERDLYIQLYNQRNNAVNTWTVWRSDYGQVLGYCASRGFGLPYDVQITNPLQTEGDSNRVVIEQAEPNGLFSSKNTNATWVFCQVPNDETAYAPIYIEDKVTVYPWPVEIDWENNRVTTVEGAQPSFTIEVNQGQ